jgi:hypothetical protein
VAVYSVIILADAPKDSPLWSRRFDLRERARRASYRSTNVAQIEWRMR